MRVGGPRPRNSLMLNELHNILRRKKMHFNTKKRLQSLFSVVYYVHEIEIPYLLEQKKE
jgi:hypothetical protein